jgi:ATPase family AAA domain-containing protein 3A/B
MLTRFLIATYLFCCIDLTSYAIPFKLEHINQAQEGLAHVHDFLEDRTQDRINNINAELLRLSKQHDEGKVGTTTFETKRSLLLKELERIQTRADQVGTAATNIITTGFSAVIAVEKERQLAEEARKTAIATAAVTQSIADEGAMQRLQFLTNPEVLEAGVKYGSLAILAGTTAFYAGRTTIRYIEQKLEKIPEIAHETSRQSMIQRGMTTIASWWGTEEEAQPALSTALVYAPAEAARMAHIAARTGQFFEKGLPFQNMLLYGPPGTGKTAYARWLSQHTGLDYVLTSGSSLTQLPAGEDIVALRELFSWAKTSPKGMIIFIDEIDAIAFDRKRNPDRRVVMLLEELLVLMSDPNVQRNCKVIAATNRYEDLDAAIHSRCGEQIFVGLPGQSEREQIFNIYLKRYITNFTTIIKEHGQKREVTLALAPDVTHEVIMLAAEKTTGLSGRTIEQLVQQMQTECCFSDYVLDKKLLLGTIDTNLQDRSKSAY